MLDPRITDVFRSHQWFWGGDFRENVDPMHFQFAVNC